jgi:hypothetical protein
MRTAVDIFVDVGQICYEDRVLAEGLELLAARLDYAGAGELVRALCGLDFTGPTKHVGEGSEAPGRLATEPNQEAPLPDFSGSKQDPKPVPTPKPPPPPRPQPKGWRS